MKKGHSFKSLIFVLVSCFLQFVAPASADQIDDVLVTHIVTRPANNAIRVAFSKPFPNVNCTGNGAYGAFTLDGTSKTSAMLSILLAAATSKTTMSVSSFECAADGNAIYQVKTNY